MQFHLTVGKGDGWIRATTSMQQHQIVGRLLLVLMVLLLTRMVLLVTVELLLLMVALVMLWRRRLVALDAPLRGKRSRRHGDLVGVVMRAPGAVGWRGESIDAGHGHGTGPAPVAGGLRGHHLRQIDG